MKKLNLHYFNLFLGSLVVMLCVYILMAPILPNINFWWKKSVVKTSPPLVTAEKNNQKPEKIPKDNTLVIPSINMQQQIFESADQSALNKGVWRNPNAGSPDQQNNTVLIGHRFTYGGPAVFYHLDKVKVGDKVVVFWNRVRREYVVRDVLVLPPAQTEIQNKDVGEELLTIYTCTPLITAKNRLVIQAKPLEGV